MSMLFLDSFSNYNATSIAALGKWQTVLDPLSQLSISAGTGRNGNASFHIAHSVGTGTLAYLQRVEASSLAAIVMGFALNVTLFDASHEDAILQWLDIATPQVTVSILPNGQIRFRSGNSGAILATSTASVINATSTYFFIEFTITFNSSTGTIAMQSNGVSVALDNSSGLNTAPSGNNTFNTTRLGQLASNSTVNPTCTNDISDFYAFSTSGARNNAFAGDSFIFPRFPTGAGASTQFTATGAASNWQAVNATSPVVPTPTTYVSDSTVGQKDLYTMTAMPSNTGTVLGVQLEQVSEKDASGARSTANTLSSSGTTADGATQALSQQYAWYLDIVEQDPNVSGAWTKTSLNALQSGPKVAA